MFKKPKPLALMLAIALPLFAGGVNAYTIYKIDIENSFIKASADDSVVELKLVGNSLVVDTLPANGFYGLKVGDRISKVNGATIQSTDAFISALGTSTDKVAAFQVVRANHTLELPIPEKGYSWFL